ncbi:hypothetical protein ESZ54_11495 [Vagococcus silagei]|uniref:Uncharacterized protein n=1 Tax=Vagococcus silagei TaxID=2508885 RepID=A0A4S3B1G7_9ENTE|nr:hypothetical protein ESZ54_11495 [Vagococcus silagei]
MTKKQSVSFSLGFIVLTTLLQTVLSVLPGYLYYQDNPQGPMILPYMLVYLLLCDFFQVFTRALYKKGRSLSLAIYAIKILASGALIYFVASQTAYQFVLIFIAYEIFQLLILSKHFFYIDSIMYSITNAIFKGLVFNQLLTISYPFNYDFKAMIPFIFAFFLILFITILTQGMYSFLSKQAWFLLLSVVCLITIYYLLYMQFSNSILPLWKFTSFIVANIIALFFFAKSKNSQKKELVLYLFGLVGLMVYYF